MGYQDEFYITENITGYTGELHNDASVYFQRGDGAGKIIFGRITQNHDHRLNIGRNTVRIAADYVIENRIVEGVEKCIEFYGGSIRHNSRHRYVNVAGLSSLQKAVLERSIYNFTESKGKNTASKSAMASDRATETRAARGTIGRGSTNSLLAQHMQLIDDAKPD